MKLRDILFTDSNPDSSHNGVLQTRIDIIDEYYHSSDHLRVKKVIKNGRIWHEDLISYKEEVLTNDFLTNNGESEPSLEGEPNFPRELNLKNSEFEQNEGKDLIKRSFIIGDS
jgi:hypothetical protein